MDWERMLVYLIGTMDQELHLDLRDSYLFNCGAV
jgi:hypothetical protein